MTALNHRCYCPSDSVKHSKFKVVSGYFENSKHYDCSSKMGACFFIDLSSAVVLTVPTKYQLFLCSTVR